MKQILINSEELQVRVAVVEDGTLQDFFMERTNKDRIVGSIYKGKIKNLEPSLQAAFVDIGVGKNAFLHYWDMLPATLEKLEGEGDDYDDDEPVKPGQERAHADMENSADEDDTYDPPSPPQYEQQAEADEEAVAEVAEAQAPIEATATEVVPEEKQTVAPEVVMDGQVIPPDTQLAEGLLPLSKGGMGGLIPLAKPAAPKAEAPSKEESDVTPKVSQLEPLVKPEPEAVGLEPLVKPEPEAVGLESLVKPEPEAVGLEPLVKPEPEAPAEAVVSTEEPVPSAPVVEEPTEVAKPIVQQISIDENPPPVPAEQPQRPNAPQNNGPRDRQRPQNQQGRPRNPNFRDGQGPKNSNDDASDSQAQIGEGGHRKRRRRNRGNRDNGNSFAQGKPQAQGAAKPGIFRRFLETLFPSLKRKRLEAQGQQPDDKSTQDGQQGKLKPLSPNSGKPELVPLTPNGKAGQPKPAEKPQPPKMEKLPKPEKIEKPKKPEKKGPTVEDIPNLFKVDQEILVQVTKGPIGTKGARVTTNISIPGRYLVLLPGCPHIGISRRVEDKEERSRLKQMIKTILPPNMGVICRTEGAGLKREHFQRDLQMLMDAWHKAEETQDKRRAPVCVYQEPALVERTLRDSLTQDIDEIVCDTKEAYDLAIEMLKRFDRLDTIKVKLYNNPAPIFIKYGISQQIEGISNRKVPLPSGGYLCIDETEALIAIDVNTGKNRSGKDQPETILATNMEAVKEIARQLRLRNIGGLVVLDLIDMRSRKDQMAVYRAFKQYTAEDHARIKVYPISGLGLLEMSRQRESESLESTMYEDCPYCKGRGLIKTATSVSVEIQRRLNELLARKKDVQHFVITVHPKILERLRTADHKVMNAMAAEHSRQLTFNADPSLHIEAFHITDKDTGKSF